NHPHALILLFLLIPPPPSPPLFPYTTLFRSRHAGPVGRRDARRRQPLPAERRHEPEPDRHPGGRRGARRHRLREVGHDDRRRPRSEEHTSELQSLRHLVCRLLLEKKKKKKHN